MNRIFQYIIACLALVSTSCEKVIHEQEENLLPPEGSGYIKFTTGVESRAPIITDMKGKSFGVIGFTYPEYQTWTSARILAEPDLCHNLQVNCSADNVCTYDIDKNTNDNQYMFWDLVNHHTFFAYYPIASQSNGVTISPATQKDTPFVKYQLPLKTDTPVNPDNLMDIMTASAIDQTVRSGNVKLQFHHRLCCIDVVARNFNDDAQTISNLSVEIGGIQYNGIQVYMHKGDAKFSSIPEKSESWNVNNEVTFDILSDAVQVAQNEVKSISGNKNIMLVPQAATLSGTVTFVKNGNTANPVTEAFSSDFDFEEGKKYSIVISFTGDDVIVLMVQSGVWEEKDDVNYEFD